MTASVLPTDLVCFSHLRWDFVHQRPQHLLNRFAQHRRVFVIEEPVYGDGPVQLDVSVRDNGVRVVVPHLPAGTTAPEAVKHQRRLLHNLFLFHKITDATFWYYTAMAMPFTRDLPASCVIYDCMDELSAFKGAPEELLEYERELFARADHVFTGGHSLYESKAPHHRSVHPFPSSIDASHFLAARGNLEEPVDNARIPEGMRLGFYGVIDERADLVLLDAVAELRPDWQLILVGPITKIDQDDLPRRSNIHYLGQKSYDELPFYLAHWDVAMMPFALNESTRFISPTKTPEYLAAGRPVVSTAIRDVVHPYGELGLVHIARTAADFVAAAEVAFTERTTNPLWLEAVDVFLQTTSWDATFAAMAELERTTGPITRTAPGAVVTGGSK